MDKQDRDSFLQMGVRGIIGVDENDGIRVSELYQRIEETYFQKCAKDLAERGRILEYSTAQYFSPDGESAIIRYYGFHTRVAAYGDSEKKMLSVDRRPKDRFADVIGAENAKGELKYFIKYLQNPKIFMEEGMERPVFVLAATNFGLEKGDEGKNSSLDPALLRRFSNRIYVDLPNEEERKKYLNLMLAKKKRIHLISEKVVQNIAERTTGQSLAVLQNIIDLAIRNFGENFGSYKRRFT